MTDIRIKLLNGDIIIIDNVKEENRDNIFLLKQEICNRYQYVYNMRFHRLRLENVQDDDYNYYLLCEPPKRKINNFMDISSVVINNYIDIYDLVDSIKLNFYDEYKKIFLLCFVCGNYLLNDKVMDELCQTFPYNYIDNITFSLDFSIFNYNDIVNFSLFKKMKDVCLRDNISFNKLRLHLTINEEESYIYVHNENFSNICGEFIKMCNEINVKTIQLSIYLYKYIKFYPKIVDEIIFNINSISNVSNKNYIYSCVREIFKNIDHNNDKIKHIIFYREILEDDNILEGIMDLCIDSWHITECSKKHIKYSYVTEIELDELIQ